MAITQNKATSQLVERLQNAKITEERREAPMGPLCCVHSNSGVTQHGHTARLEGGDMIQQTARPISLEMALRDMIAAGHKVQLSAEISAWFDELYDRIRTGGEMITHETLGLSIEFLDSERSIRLGKGDELDLVIRNHYGGSLLLTMYRDGVHIGTGTALIKESLFRPRVAHPIFKGRVNRALEGALGGTRC